jgi:2-haloacid dehalogenase
MAEADAVVFDVGGVLIEWDPRHLYRKLFDGDHAAMERFLATVCTPAWNLEQDRGRPFAEAVAELSDRFPEHAALIAAYDERWDEMVPGPVHGGPEVLAELQAAGVACYGLTNFSTEKFRRARRRFPFLGSFDGVVVSGAEGVVKPEPAIFRCLARRYALDPARTLFVDDQPANVAAAENLGFRGHRFTTADRLRAELDALRLLPPAADEPQVMEW